MKYIPIKGNGAMAFFAPAFVLIVVGLFSEPLGRILAVLVAFYVAYNGYRMNTEALAAGEIEAPHKIAYLRMEIFAVLFGLLILFVFLKDHFFAHA